MLLLHHRIKSIEINAKNFEGYNNFKIAGSKNVDNQITEISPDIAVCDDCLAELTSDPEESIILLSIAQIAVRGLQ